MNLKKKRNRKQKQAENSPTIFKLCGGFALNTKIKKMKKMDDKY